MTVSSEISTAGPFFGNGSTTVFPYGFKITSAEHIRVTIIGADSQPRDLSLEGGDYSVSGVGEETGGDVIKASPLITGERLYVRRNPPFTQETSLENQGPYYPNVVEDRFDLAVMQIQTLKDVADRSVTTAIGIDPIQITENLPDNATLMKKGKALVPGPDIVALAATTIQQATDEADRSRAEADRSASARDIAAAYASDAVSQGNVPIYGTVSGLSGLNIPAGINAIRLNGFSASGDGGGWPLAKEVPNSGALMAWQRQSNGGTRRWELVVDNPKPEMFGGMGDGADNAAALLNTSDYITARGGGEIVLGGGKNFFSLTEVNFGDVTIRAEPEAKLSGFINMKADFRFDRPVDIHRSGEGGNNYLPLPVTSKHRRPIQEKEVFFTTADGNYSVEIALQPSQLDHVQVQDGADTFFPVSAASTTDRTVTHDLVAGYLRGSEIRARGGDELSVGFENGGFDHVAFIRTTGGYYEVRSNGFAGAASVWFKASGAASAKLFDFDWTGRSDHADWQPGYADWRIRLLSLQRWTLMLNGVDVLFGGVTLASGSLITHVGYGARSSEAIQFSISDWVITRSDDTAGRGYMQVLTCGDSTVAPYHGDWSTYLEELLEGSLGIGSKVKNIGVDGWTMETTYNTLIAHGLTGVNVVVLNAGVNNAQNSNTISIAKTLTDLQAIIEYVQAANVRLIINLHANYYAKGSSGLGVVVYNEQSAPRYRQAIRRMAASYGVKVVDKSSELKPTFKYERDASPPLPVFQDAYRSGLRDNIHDSAARCRAIAHAVCRAIIGLLPRKRRGFDEIDVPASILNTALGFAQPSTNKARISLTDSGDLGLGGEISGGTRTNGNSILAVPENLRPAGPRVFRTLTVNGTSIRLILSSNGSLLIYDAGSDTSNIILDSLRWRVS